MEHRRRFQLLVLAIFALLLSHCILVLSSSGDGPNKKPSTTPGDKDDEDEDISFLEEPLDTSSSSSSSHAHDTDSDDEHDDDFDQGSYEEPPPPPPVDDKDVVVLTQANFSDFLSANKHVMVEFYAPWCGHCQALAPEYAAAATELKDHDVVLAKVDATEENDLTQKYEIQGFPTVLFYLAGVQKTYPGQRTKDGIVTWIKKKIGPGLHDVKTVEDAQEILTREVKLAVAFVNSLEGTESLELTAASKLEDDVNFYQTINPDVAQLFSIDPKAKRPSLVLLKKESGKIIHFDGQFTKSSIADFVFANKMPLVTPFTRESAQLIFDNPIKKQLLLFSTSNGSAEVLPIFEEAAKPFKGKLIFVYVDMDNEDVGVPVSNYFGVTGEDPTVIAYTGNDDAKKYILKGKVTLDSIKVFGDNFLQDNLKPFYKSDPIPEKNDGDVIVVVGNSFEDVVLDESKDVLLEIYAPWCGHCQSLEPTYNKLAKHLRSIDSLIIAKMDGTTNEHPRAKADGFPTLLFFPAGNKSFEPLTVETDRTVVALYKFIKKHASIPFKLQKPVPAAKSDGAGEAEAARESMKSPSDGLKDEL